MFSLEFLNWSSDVVMDWIVSLQNSFVEALIPNVTVFEDRAFKDVIKSKWGDKSGILIQ